MANRTTRKSPPSDPPPAAPAALRRRFDEFDSAARTVLVERLANTDPGSLDEHRTIRALVALDILIAARRAA